MKLLITLAPLLLATLANLRANSPTAEQPVAFDTHTGYFVSNKFEPDAPTSFVVLPNQAAFDKVFGVGMVMRDRSHRLPSDAFDKLLVVAAIHRGKAVVTYKAESVTAAGKTLVVRYTTKSEPSATAEFACPLIVSVAKDHYETVRFIENGNEIKRAEITPNSQPPRPAPAAPIPRY